MGLSDGRKSFPIGLAVLIQYRSVTATQPASHVAVAITLYAKASSLKSVSKIRLVRWLALLETIGQAACQLHGTLASRSQSARKRLPDYTHPWTTTDI